MYREFFRWFSGRVRAFWWGSSWPVRIVCMILVPVLVVAACSLVVHCAGVTP